MKQSQSEKAYKIAKKAHLGQVDKAGEDYIKHPKKVASFVKTDEEKAVAYLHDVIEDSDLYCIDDFSFLDDEQLEAIKLLTHSDGEEYFTYINKVKTNKIAKAVKLSDLRHNSNLKRLKNITEKDLERRTKYLKAIEILGN